MARNERFAAARAAAELTASEVADQIADWIDGKTGKRPRIDADHIGRIERGLITWPGKEYRDALRAVLRVASNADLGLHCRSRGTRKPAAVADLAGQLVAYTAAATVNALDDSVVDSLSADLGKPATPARIGRTDVEDLHRVIDGMERADHSAGGRTVVRSLALGQLGWAQSTLRLASFPNNDVRNTWMSAVARLGRLAGFMSVDAREHDQARKCFVVALKIAAQAEDWPSRLNVLSGMARQAVHLGDGAVALQFVTLARAGESAVSVTTQAMLHVLEARAYGVLGRAPEAVDAVRRAEDMFAQRRPEDDPPWLWFYDEAQLLGDTGHALYPLALRGADVDATQRLRQAVDRHQPSDTRGRTFSLTKLATLLIRDDPGSAAALGSVRESIVGVAQLRSGRAADYLGDLGRELRRAGTDETLALAGDVTRTLEAVRRG
jgi:hypothetical protein